jgi:hypothetical protein
VHEDLSLDQIRETAGASEAYWVDPPKEVLFIRGRPDDPAEKLRPARMLYVGGTYVVEAIDHRGSWFMGGERSDGVVVCWGDYWPLADALRSL